MQQITYIPDESGNTKSALKWTMYELGKQEKKSSGEEYLKNELP